MQVSCIQVGPVYIERAVTAVAGPMMGAARAEVSIGLVQVPTPEGSLLGGMEWAAEAHVRFCKEGHADEMMEAHLPTIFALLLTNLYDGWS